MRKKLSLLLLFLVTLLSAQEAEESNETKPAIRVEQIVLQTIINQRTKTDNNAQHRFGKKLINYLNALDNESFKETFATLPYRAKIMYMIEMNTQQYEFFLQRYSDKEWQTFWSSLTAEEQQHIPKTLTEQLTVIRNAYREFYDQNTNKWFSKVGDPSPYPSDLKKFKKLCYKDLNPHNEYTYRDRYTISGFFLDAYMHRERLALFNI